MSDLQGPVTIPEPGQTPVAPDTGTTTDAPDGMTGQASAPTVEAGQAEQSAAPADDSFFDPSTVPSELQPAYKSMQAAFTKKMQAISGQRQKVEAFDRFMADPVRGMQDMAKQYGLTLSRAEAQAAVHNQDWNPNTWEDVLNKAEERAVQRVMEQFAPIMQTVQKVQASNIEAQLAKLDPEWRRYEDEMRSNLQAHPSLVNDVGKLYRLSVPEDVYMGRATQEALKRMQSKAAAAQVAEKGSTSRSAPAPQRANSFDEAVAIAKQRLAEQGR